MRKRIKIYADNSFIVVNEPLGISIDLDGRGEPEVHDIDEVSDEVFQTIIEEPSQADVILEKDGTPNRTRLRGIAQRVKQAKRERARHHRVLSERPDGVSLPGGNSNNAEPDGSDASTTAGNF